MKKIALLCAAGMSTSVLVQKMRDAAAEASFECEIDAYPVASAEEVGETADCLLLGPQVRYELDNVRAKVSCPSMSSTCSPMAPWMAKSHRVRAWAYGLLGVVHCSSVASIKLM